MSKIGKTFSIVGALVVVGIGLGGWWAYGHLGLLIKQAVESAGPEITGTTVKLNGATVSIFSGEGALRGLSIGNPAGYSDSKAFELGKIATVVDVASVTDEVIRIRSIEIDGAKLLAEFNTSGVSNLQTILAHARAAAGGGRKKASPESGAQQQLIIESFLFSNAEVRVVAPELKADETLKLGTIQLRNLGAKQGGAAASDIASQILRPVVDAAVKAATQKVLNEQRDKLRDRVEEKLLDKLFQ